VIVELNATVEFDGDYSLPGSDVYSVVAEALGLRSDTTVRATRLRVGRLP
jgi:hypothetical protein